MADDLPFWKTKTLARMSRAEWESLCDGCGRCCLHKLRDEDTEELVWTTVACRLLDTQSCQCRDYPNRRDHVPDCVKLTPRKLAKIDWLPPSCAYRLVAEGKDLPDWHPLISGDPETVHTSGASVRGRAVPERQARDLEDHLAEWPGTWPSPAKPDAPAPAAPPGPPIRQAPAAFPTQEGTSHEGTAPLPPAGHRHRADR